MTYVPVCPLNTTIWGPFGIQNKIFNFHFQKMIFIYITPLNRPIERRFRQISHKLVLDPFPT